MPDINSIVDRRDGDERRALSPLGNGKGEWARWVLEKAAAVAIAALLAYGAVSNRITKLETQLEEIHRFMQRIDATLTVLQQQERNRRD